MKRKLLSLFVLLMTAVTGAWAGTKATGYVDHCTAHHGSIHVDGWAYDPDQPSVSINVHAYIWYGSSVGTTKEERLPAVGINTDVYREDVNNSKGITGLHGFDRYIAVPAGTYTVQIYAIDKTGDGNPVIPGTGSSGNPAAYTVTVTAPYTITYDANGGSGAPDAQQKSEKIKINLSATAPTRDGYIFKEWNTKQDGSGVSYAPGAAYTADGDATLYAQWLAVTASGTSGDVSWTLTEDGVMTISGMGAMAAFEDYNHPWETHVDKITSVVIESGVTSIGESAFFDCYNLASVSIPASVTTIGENAFSDCGKEAATLTLTIADGSALTTIGDGAFYGTKLTSITIPAGVTNIGMQAFDGCTNLTTITLNSNPFIDDLAFPSTATVTMNLTANSADGAYWMTFYNQNYDFEADANTQIFKAALTGTKLELTKLKTDQTVTKDNPVILKSTAGTITMTLTSTASGNDFSSNSLEGVSAAAGLTAADPSTTYVLNYKAATGVGFYKLQAGKTLGVGKAYLEYDDPTAPSFFGFGDETTGIMTLNATPHSLRENVEHGTLNDDSWFTLDGRRIANGQKPKAKGLYIVNGKKFVIK